MRAAKQPWIASRTFSIAATSVSPWETHPGRDGHAATILPVSSRWNVMSSRMSRYYPDLSGPREVRPGARSEGPQPLWVTINGMVGSRTARPRRKHRTRCCLEHEPYGAGAMFKAWHGGSSLRMNSRSGGMLCPKRNREEPTSEPDSWWRAVRVWDSRFAPTAKHRAALK